MGNNIRNTLNQASSDSELAGEFMNRSSHGPLGDSSDLHLKKSDKDLHSLISSSKYIYLSPMQNMKHNVTEKVAQVSISSLKPVTNLAFCSISYPYKQREVTYGFPT